MHHKSGRLHQNPHFLISAHNKLSSAQCKGCRITKGSVLLGEEHVNSILEKVKNLSVKGCMPVRPQISNLNENITLYRERLEENTANELKYFCKKNLLPRVGSKSELIARVQSNLHKRKLEVIELRVKSQN